MSMDTRMTMSRRGLLATMAAMAGAAVAGTLARAERALAAGSDGEAVAIGAHYDDVRSATTFRTAAHDTTVMDFRSVEGEQRRMVRLGPDGFRSERHGHWSRETVVIDGTVQAIGGGAEAAGTGPMIVGEGDTVGVYGRARAEGPGVRGRGSVGVEGIGITGVSATGEGGSGVEASGLRGGTFAGNVAQLQLRPSGSTSHPAQGDPGDLFVDASCRLWFCRGGASWSRVA